MNNKFISFNEFYASRIYESLKITEEDIKAEYEKIKDSSSIYHTSTDYNSMPDYFKEYFYVNSKGMCNFKMEREPEVSFLLNIHNHLNILYSISDKNNSVEYKELIDGLNSLLENGVVKNIKPYIYKVTSANYNNRAILLKYLIEACKVASNINFNVLSKINPDHINTDRSIWDLISKCISSFYDEYIETIKGKYK